MNKIKKYLFGSPLFGKVDYKKHWDILAQKMLPVPDLSKPQSFNNTTKTNPIASSGIRAITDTLSDKLSDKLFGESELGGALGNIFSLGVSSAGNTIADNLLKGQALSEGLSTNVGTSLAGAGTGIVSNLIGQGINALGGDSKLSRGLGLGVSTGLGMVGGTALSNLINTGKLAGNASKLFGTGDNIFTTTKIIKDAATGAKTASAAAAINPYALGASVLGSGLSAAFGPSKEYGGTYGGITRGMDTAYDIISAGVNFIPGIGLTISGAMVLNKGLSNIFGSTDGMTRQDAILGSAFMPAPIKWINMWGSSKTGTFDNQSRQNLTKTNSFMQNAFGDLGDKFNQARNEANKTYGTFSQGAKRKALRNIDFSNQAFNTIMDMANQNEYQLVRSEDMSSINNLRYALLINGGFNPIYVGKQGMKIFNNATNHNIGMRLLSAAALIDDKQMILSALSGTKVNGYTSAIKRTANYDPDETIFTFPENINVIKTDAKKSKDWINWWLMNRENVLALNMKSTEEEAKKERWRQVARINPNLVQIKNTKDVNGEDIGAYTNPNTKQITFKPFVQISKGLITHEQTHSMGDNKYLNALTKKIKELLPKFSYTHPNDKKPNNYWNNPIEIYGRLMQFRRDNKINPKHKFTLNEIKSWYFENNGNLYGNGKMNDASNMLLFYSPETMQMLLNEVAQNPIQFNDNFSNMV